MNNKLDNILSIMVWLIYIVLIIKLLYYLVDGFSRKRDMFILVVILLLCIFMISLIVYGIYYLLGCNRQIMMRPDIKLPQPFASWSNSL